MNKLERMLSANGSKTCREGKEERKRKRKRSTGMMMMMMMMMIHITHPRTTMMTARLTPSSGPPDGTSGKLMRRATRK